MQSFIDEPALDLGGITLSAQKETVRVFYKELWGHADKSLIPEIFHADFTFRGSLGPALVGHDQFAGCVARVIDRLERGVGGEGCAVFFRGGNALQGRERFDGKAGNLGGGAKVAQFALA